jgi:hypothetical protein
MEIAVMRKWLASQFFDGDAVLLALPTVASHKLGAHF